MVEQNRPRPWSRRLALVAGCGLLLAAVLPFRPSAVGRCRARRILGALVPGRRPRLVVAADALGVHRVAGTGSGDPGLRRQRIPGSGTQGSRAPHPGVPGSGTRGSEGYRGSGS